MYVIKFHEDNRGTGNPDQPNQLEDDIKVVKTGCFGLCAEGPIMMIYPDHLMYTLVQPEDVDEIFESHVMNGTAVQRLLAGNKEAEKIENALENVDFFSKTEECRPQKLRCNKP